MCNFNDLNWGKTHGSQPTDGEAAKSIDKEKSDGLEESTTGLEESTIGAEESTTGVEESTTTGCGEAPYALESSNRCQNLLMRWDSFESEECDPLPSESEDFYDINLLDDDEAERNGISIPLLHGEIV